MHIDKENQLPLIAAASQTMAWNDSIAILDDRSVPSAYETAQRRIIKQIASIVASAFKTILSSVLCRPITIEFLNLQKERKDLTSTISALKKIFGNRRIDRAFSWCDISIEKLLVDGRMLSKKDFSNIYHSLSMITKEDIDELLEELRGAATNIRGMSGDDLDSLRKRFTDKTTLESCSPDEISHLETILLPFQRPEDLFWNNPANHANTLSLPITFFDTTESVAWTCHLLRQQKAPLKNWEVIFAKRLAQPRLPHHLIVPHSSGGYLCLSHTVEGGGASKRFFRSLHPQKASPHVLYRGTRGPMPGDSPEDIVRSWLEDLKRELGSSGPITTYKETKDLLERPEQGFADSADQKITFVTNSIGGPQAMRDTILFHKRVSRLTTNASPGVDRETADLFREVLSQPRETPLIITHNIDKGDIVDTVGDEHVGANCPNASLTFRSLALASPHAPAQEGQRRWSVANRLETFLFSGIPQLLSNVMGIFEAHMRTSVIENYTEEVVSTDDPATHDIAIAYAQHLPPHFDPSWERVRRFICPVPSPGFAAFARQVLGTA